MSDFSQNLRLVCGEKHSVSALCRDIGINRQQFSKYLNGSTTPSAHNLRRICAYFSMDERVLFLPHESFRAQYGLGTKSSGNPALQSLIEAFPGDRAAARRYVGLYHCHFNSPSWPKTILRALVQISERDGLIVSRTVEHAIDPGRGVRQRTKYLGVVAMLGDRLFVVERVVPDHDSIVETILFPARRRQLNYLRGLTLGMSWRPRRTPFASKSIWKRLPEATDARAALRACGAFALDDRAIDPVVRDFLGDEIYPPRDGDQSEALF